MVPPDAFDTDFERFSDADLLSWFHDNVAGTDQFNGTLELLSAMRVRSSKGLPEVDDALEEGAKALLDNQGIIPSAGPRDIIKRVDWSAAFARLGRESKLKLLQGWVRQYPGPDELVFLRDPADIDVDFGPDPDSDPEWQNSDFTEVTISLPDGTEMVDSAESNRDYVPTDYEVPPDPKPSSMFDLSKWTIRIGIGGVLGLVLAVGVFVTAGGDSSDTTEIDSSATTEIDSSASSGTPAPTPVPPVADANPCSAVREQEPILELTSPDVQPVIPFGYGAGLTDFLAPAFNWSQVPEETTEIAILVLRLDDERAALYAEDPLLWWGGPSIGAGGVPLGKAIWLVTGIDPSANGLAQSSQKIPLPNGAIERSTPGGGYAQYGDLEGDFMYRGTGTPGVKHLFTVFALCDPAVDFVDDPGVGWLRRFSIAAGWFISESA